MVAFCIPAFLLSGCNPYDGPDVTPPLREETLTVNTNVLLSLDEDDFEPRTIKVTMVEIPGGYYRVGSPPDEPGRGADEKGPGGVEVKTFWIGKFEVTWDQYDAYYMNRESAADAETWPSLPFEPPDDGRGKGVRAAQRVRPISARGFCAWLSEQTGWNFRLPTGDEWEVACRAGSPDPRPEPIDEYAWHKGNSANGDDDKPRNQPVGTKKANAWGLHDMLGNVWELVDSGAEREEDEIYRGGSYEDPVTELRASNRQGVLRTWNQRDPQIPKRKWWYTDGPHLGFRLAADRPAEK